MAAAEKNSPTSQKAARDRKVTPHTLRNKPTRASPKAKCSLKSPRTGRISSPKSKATSPALRLSAKRWADYAEFCRNIKDMVVGKAAQKAGLRFDGKNQRFFLEDASAENRRSGEPVE